MEPSAPAAIKNIYQRMIEVQKNATSVDKTDTVKMSENDKGYKAVTHDEVAKTLHLPLANAGVLMLPDIVDFKTTEFERPNQWGKVQRWYRTDINILVKWINVDDPNDFISSKGAAFALDTSDKSFAKAYSLALKIVLLKVHLLESRDGEEQRVFEDEQAPPPNQNQQKQSKPKQQAQTQTGPKPIVAAGPKPQPKADPFPPDSPQTPPLDNVPTVDPNEYVIPFGPWKDKVLRKLDRKIVKGYLSTVIDTANAQGKEIKGDVLEFVTQAESYLAEVPQ